MEDSDTKITNETKRKHSLGMFLTDKKKRFLKEVIKHNGQEKTTKGIHSSLVESPIYYAGFMIGDKIISRRFGGAT